MGEINSRNQKNGREVSSGELRRDGLYVPIGVDISDMRNEGYWTGIIGAETFLQENFLPHNLFEKSKTLPPIVGSLSTSTVKKYVLGLCCWA